MNQVLADPWLLWYIITGFPHPTIVRGLLIVFKNLRDYVKRNNLQDQLYSLLSTKIISNDGQEYTILPNGYRHGLYQRWECNGQILERINYSLNKRHGLFNSWYYTGKLMKQVNYIHGEKDGLYQYWNKNGTLLYRIENYVVGKINGVYQEFYNNGQLRQESHFVDNKKTSCKMWDPIGNPID